MTDKPKVNTDCVDREGREGEGGRGREREENYIILLIPRYPSIRL